MKAKIDAALRRRAKVEADNITVAVKDGGLIVLNRTADNSDGRQAVDSAEWPVPGVQSVDGRHRIVA